MKFAKFLRTPILKNICEQLLLYHVGISNELYQELLELTGVF